MFERRMTSIELVGASILQDCAMMLRKREIAR
jgi:hypothetical protein